MESDLFFVRDGGINGLHSLKVVVAKDRPIGAEMLGDVINGCEDLIEAMLGVTVGVPMNWGGLQ